MDGRRERSQAENSSEFSRITQLEVGHLAKCGALVTGARSLQAARPLWSVGTHRDGFL